jgi:hypothetical protein
MLSAGAVPKAASAGLPSAVSFQPVGDAGIGCLLAHIQERSMASSSVKNVFVVKVIEFQPLTSFTE